MIVYKGRLLRKSSNRKPKLVLSTLVTIWLSNIAFHLQLIWLQTLVVIDSESCQISFPSFYAQPSEVSMLFYSNLSTRPFLGQESQDVNLDLLLCTGFDLGQAALFLCHIFTQKPFNDRKIERSYGRCAGRQQLLANSIENFSSHEEKKVTHCCPKFTNHKTFLTLELSQYCKSGSMSSSSEPVAACSYCCWLGNTLCLCLPVQPAQAVPERGPKSSAIDLAVKSSIVFWNSLLEWLPDDWQGLEFAVWILFSSVKNAKIEDSCELIPTIIHHTALLDVTVSVFWLWCCAFAV